MYNDSLQTPADKQNDNTAEDEQTLDTFCLLSFTGSLPQYTHLDVVQSDRDRFVNADHATGQLHKSNPEVSSNE